MPSNRRATGDGRTAPSWVVIDEVKPGQLLIDGRDMTGVLIPVVIHVHHLTGPLDDLARQEAAALIRDICSEALPAGESRSVAPLVLATGGENAWWGGSGHLFRLLPETAYGRPPPPAFAGATPSTPLPTASRADP